MALDINTELAAAQAEFASAQQAARTLGDTLHLASIHLSNVKALLKPKPLPPLGCYIIDNGSYNASLIARMKGYIDTIAKSTFEHVIVFQNFQQMVTDKFPQYILDAGLTPTFDTMRSVFRITTPAQREQWFIQAEKFNPHSYRWDDAQNQTVDEIASQVKFARQFTDRPIYGTFGAEDVRIVTDPVTGEERRESFDMQAYVQAGLIPTRQFFRQDAAGSENPTAPVVGWLHDMLPPPDGKSLIVGGVDLEAFRASGVTTSPEDFTAMLLMCLNAGIDVLTVHTSVNGSKWLMWNAAAELWQAVQAGAETVRLWKQ